jgi:uncharacterized protein (TIGR02145 family)
MKNAALILSAAVLSAVLLSSFIGSSIEEDAFAEVIIGKQVWMSENLNLDKFRNGDPIPEAKTQEEWKRAAENNQPAWCYYNNDPANGGIYGKLYNWHAVNDSRGLAPVGYHIPTDAEWTALTDFLGGTFAAGIKMKTTSEWDELGNGTNESGFSGLPGGYRNLDAFHDAGGTGVWWSSTEKDAATAWHRSMDFLGNDVIVYSDIKGKGASVRCLRD